MDALSPPRYRRLSSRPGPVPQSDSELPPYTRRTFDAPTSHRDRTEHLYDLMNSKNKPWATLKLLSSAKSSNLLPTFFQGEDVTGSVVLNLQKEDPIQAVTVSVSCDSRATPFRFPVFCAIYQLLCFLLFRCVITFHRIQKY